MAQPHTVVSNIVTRAPISREGEPSPTPLSNPARPLPYSRSPITLHSALLSTLRIWLLHRDTALWSFCSGTDPADPLCDVSHEQSADAVRAMNEARRQCRAFAEQLSVEGGDVQSANQILRAAIDELLAVESPQFPLSLSDIPGSF